jgi:hypothetical protein
MSSLPEPDVQNIDNVTSALEIAIKTIYRRLEVYRQPARSAWSPYSGITEKDAAKLYSKPLPQLSPDDLERYARSAMTTWGDETEFKHYLPRMLELMVMEPGWTDAQILIGRLTLAGWSQWPIAEREAVTGYLRALWSWALDAGPDVVNAGALLRGFAEAAMDVGPALDEWHANRNVNATRQIAHVLLEEEDDLLSGQGLRRAWGTAATPVMGFLSSSDVQSRFQAVDPTRPIEIRREFEIAAGILDVLRSRSTT